MNIYRLFQHLTIMALTGAPIMDPGTRGGYRNIAYNRNHHAIVMVNNDCLVVDDMKIEWRADDGLAHR